MGRLRSIVNKSELAAELRLSRGRISQLLKAGMPERPDGRLDRESCIDWYRSHVLRRAPLEFVASPPATNGADAGPDLPAGSGTAAAAGSLIDFRTRREELKLRKELLELEQLRASLMPISEVKAETMALAMAEREALLNWPARVAGKFAAKFGVAESEAFALLDDMVREFLREQSNLPVPTDGGQVEKEEIDAT
jgi:hypothetical protein